MIYNMASSGTYTADATANASLIESGMTAYVATGKVTGTATMLNEYNSVPNTEYEPVILVNGAYYGWSNASGEYEELQCGDVVAAITAVPTKVFSYGESISATVTAYYSNGTNSTVSGATFSPSTATDTAINVWYTENGITRTYRMPIGILPDATTVYHNGEATIIDEGNGAWTMQCLTSGTLDLKVPYVVDVYCVGGGGGGAIGEHWQYYSVTLSGGGGGGGYTHRANTIQLTQDATYPVVVGAGGAGCSYDGVIMGSAGNGNNGQHLGGLGIAGGTSSALNAAAPGGNGGGDPTIVNAYNSSEAADDKCGCCYGGNGGSGGGCGDYGNMTTYGDTGHGPTAGASNGGNAANAHSVWQRASERSAYMKGGLGQDSSTRDFGDSNGTLRCGGGGGSGGVNRVDLGWSYNANNGSTLGGDGGGGNGCRYTSDKSQLQQAGNGAANYGGGGGGGSKHGETCGIKPGAGGSGIVIIRTHR